MPSLLEDLRDLAGARGHSRSTAPEEIAIRLGWSSRFHRVEFLPSPAPAARVFLGSEPALYLGTTDSIDRDEVSAIVGQAAFSAYHASVEWGAILAPTGISVFNSEWMKNGDWFRLPSCSWSDQGEVEDIINSLTPAGVETGTLRRFALSVHEPDTFIVPVDDALVARLDRWRTAALETANSPEGVDHALQSLFAQFFVLRAVEDRHLAEDIPTLESVLRSDGHIDMAALIALFDFAKAGVQSELFAHQPFDALRPEIIAGVIRDLYFPSHLPAKSTRYDFALLDVDVLGRAYEKYLSYVLHPGAPLAQQELFRPFVRAVEQISVRKRGGVYYTPEYLVRALTSQALDATDTHRDIRQRWAGDFPTPAEIAVPLTANALRASEDNRLEQAAEVEADELPFVADFACGSGHFLVAAADHLLRKLKALDPERDWAKQLIAGRHLVGIDIDQGAVTVARLNLWIRLAADPKSLPLPALNDAIVCADSLSTEVWERLPAQFDVILGNPPFIATGQLPPREELSKRFVTARGRFDLSYLFVELAVTKLKAGGVLSLVIPNRLFRNEDAAPARALLTERTNLLSLCDFGANEVFEGTSAYIGTITARRRGRDDEEARTVRVVRVHELDVKFLGALLTRAAEESNTLSNDTIDAFFSPHPRGDGPWIFALLLPRERAQRLLLGRQTACLADVAIVKQGIRTGANDLFIFRVLGHSSDLARVVNGFEETFAVEMQLLRPVLFGTEIQRYDRSFAKKLLLYPYRRGALVEEQELKQSYPKTWEYLKLHKDVLSTRSSLVRSSLRWYELVRKREELWLSRPKLLIRDLAIDTAFAVDDLGDTFLVGGTAVVPADVSSLWSLLAFLNSRLISEHLRQMTPTFRGGFQKFEPRHLEQIPVPEAIVSPGDIRDRLEHLAKKIVTGKAAGEETTGLESAIEEILQSVLERDVDEEATAGMQA